MDPAKAPGPDGMVPLFFEKYWHLVATFSILVNGEPKGNIVPSRGLRQGDPLSPFLFLLYTEVLISLLKVAALDQDIPGIKICRGAPVVNHLLFADDSVIFCKVDVGENRKIQALLERYELIWGVQGAQQYDKYLELPPAVGRSKSKAFSDNKQRSWRILKEPNSLLHKIYKARYFPHGSLLEAGLGRTPSFARRGIFEATKVLKQGCAWKIGDGKTARLWKDPWIPGHQALMQEHDTDLSVDFQEAFVDRLIDTQTGGWNVTQLRALFNSNLVANILKVPLYISNQPDQWIWAQERSGKFTVAMKVVEQGNEGEFAFMFCLAWGFWWRRNHMVHGQKIVEVQQVVDNALAVYNFYKEIQLLPRPMVRAFYEWKPPLTDWLKVNVDGVVFRDIHKAGVGMVLLNDKGEVLWATTKLEDEGINAEAIELLAIFRALQMCVGMGINKLVVESNCLMAVKVLNAEIECSALLNDLVREIKEVQTLYTKCQIQHVYREENGVAHRLARFAWNVECTTMCGLVFQLWSVI
ncbi:uncharacterized protein LOC122276823 [Carya illinoinensis]|uniref:uncharacterized protein LOC122276823 n=1 Tax=Carya illinoinensis TaxID=32201 RepID=UPI001C71C23F|nr:uncharacterized protein LOC122276823 [Carya illinoinensis]